VKDGLAPFAAARQSSNEVERWQLAMQAEVPHPKALQKHVRQGRIKLLCGNGYRALHVV